ncbi:hypothetical protein GE061_014869 [Apolygus lucorum]|uniref:Uncharacterized protein n=1 Tax=Apolygus lucorum TaxID=248454 RepID=A0A8S9XM67_APOLU|nr:hypothetical protein GE061_014869 [Apolygus lucorum]
MTILLICLMVLLLIAIFLILYLTKIYDLLQVVGFLAVLAFVLDIFIFDPVYILLLSLWTYYVLESSNKESYLWNEDAKVAHPKPVDLMQYSIIATQAEYKPLTTEAMEIKKRRQYIFSRLRAIIFTSCSLLAILSATGALEHDYGQHIFYTTQGLTRQLVEPEYYARRPSYEIDKVNSPPKVVDFILNNLGAFVKHWYNGKHISNFYKGRWARDLISRPIGASEMIILLIPKGSGGVRVKKILAEYFDHTAGYLTQSNQRQGELQIFSVSLYCMNESTAWLTGKSGENYYVRGHNVSLPVVNFQLFYSILIGILGEVIEGMDKNIPRAIIFTTNYINSYSRRIMTIDAVLEFLPSGVSSAKLHVRTFPVYEIDQWVHETYAHSLTILIVIHFILTLNEMMKYERGIVSYFLSLHGFLKLIIYPLSIALAISQLNRDEGEAIDQIVNLPDFQYVDLHHIYRKATFEASLILIIINALVLDTLLSVWWMYGSDQLKQTITAKCIHICICLFLLQLYIFTDFSTCTNWMDSRFLSLEVSLLLKEGSSVEKDYDESSSEDSKYFEIENHERRLEYDNRATPAYPEAESYVIGVKRALLPFRQLSKYLRRPVAADARSATVTEVPGIQWRLPVPPPNELVMAAPDTEDRVANHKRDKSESEGDDMLYPEIILIRPINISKLSAAKINNINKGLEDAIKARKAPEDVKLTDDSIKTAVTKQQKLSACTENQKKVKIDHQIFQGNDILLNHGKKHKTP